MIKYNEQACERIAIQIRNKINDELYDYLSTPLNQNDMSEGYSFILKLLGEMK